MIEGDGPVVFSVKAGIVDLIPACSSSRLAGIFHSIPNAYCRRGRPGGTSPSRPLPRAAPKPRDGLSRQVFITAWPDARALSSGRQFGRSCLYALVRKVDSAPSRQIIARRARPFSLVLHGSHAARLDNKEVVGAALDDFGVGRRFWKLLVAVFPRLGLAVRLCPQEHQFRGAGWAVEAKKNDLTNT